MDRYFRGSTVACCMKHMVLNDATDTWVETSMEANYPLLTIYDPSGNAVVTDAVVPSVATGRFRYVYTIADDAPVGFWRRVYKGKYISGSETQYPMLEDGFWVD